MIRILQGASHVDRFFTTVRNAATVVLDSYDADRKVVDVRLNVHSK